MLYFPRISIEFLVRELEYRGEINMHKLSIIVPCFNEEEVLNIFYKELEIIINQLNYQTEILFINDGSIDRTLEVIKQLSDNDDRVKFISFSRNFGKEAAILAGFEESKGDLVVMMDADLQDPPKLLPEMIRYIEEDGYDSVATRRVSRVGEPKIRSFFARQFYKIINKISKTDVVYGARDYRLMTRQFVEAVLSLQEYNRFSKGIFGWIGFDTKWIEFENVERVAGETKWSFWKLFVYALDGIVAFSTVPLYISSIIGFLFSIISVILILFFVIKTLIWGDPVSGYPSLVSIILLVSGVLLMSIGLLGQYLSKIYLETKKRPQYIIKEKSNDER